MIHDFVHLRATTVAEALDLLDEHRDDCKVICGGQSLLILMRQGLISPGHLIDIKRVEELNYIEFDPQEGLRIGATTTHRDVERSPVIAEHFPVLVEMEEGLASIQTRNWGTIGGNLAHGEPAGCVAPVLIALGADLRLASKARERTVPVEEFTRDYFETELEEDELILEIRVPPMPPRSAVAYEKFNIIKNDMGIVSVAAFIELEEGVDRCLDARIALGGAASTPLRAKETEGLLRELEISDEVLALAGERASQECEPVDDIHASAGYRRSLVEALTRKMVREARERAVAGA